MSLVLALYPPPPQASCRERIVRTDGPGKVSDGWVHAASLGENRSVQVVRERADTHTRTHTHIVKLMGSGLGQNEGSGTGLRGWKAAIGGMA